MRAILRNNETPDEILDRLRVQVNDDLAQGWVDDGIVLTRIWFLANCQTNRAGVRFLMSCMLAKVHRPEVDPREPYTEIGTPTSFFRADLRRAIYHQLHKRKQSPMQYHHCLPYAGSSES